MTNNQWQRMCQCGSNNWHVAAAAATRSALINGGGDIDNITMATVRQCVWRCMTWQSINSSSRGECGIVSTYSMCGNGLVARLSLRPSG